MRSEHSRLIIHALAGLDLHAFLFPMRKEVHYIKDSAVGKLQNFYIRKTFESLGRFSLSNSQFSSAREPGEITELRRKIKRGKKKGIALLSEFLFTRHPPGLHTIMLCSFKSELLLCTAHAY